MAIILKEYQEKAVSNLLGSICRLLDLDNHKSFVTFQAPTGSGKTVIMAKTIEGLIKTTQMYDICFIWMSIGKGELHEQSKQSLEYIFGGYPKCSLIEKEFMGNKTSIAQNEVIIANWEKLRTKYKETNEWKNVLMREGDYISFPEILDNTRSKYRIILIIDESYSNASTERSDELRDIIDPSVTIEMSATPTREPTIFEMKEKIADYISVDYKDVIRSEMIKKEILVNPGIKEFSEKEDEKENQYVILGTASEKRNRLKKLYKTEGSFVNPLCLIQIPNSDEGDNKIDFIESFLKRQGVTQANGKLAIWTSNYKSSHLNRKYLRKPYCDIEFLVFKQAIDTGWDCPRAHIWVKFRDIKSEVFAVQTLGRILRMPEQKHYENNELNTGYVFTTSGDIRISKETYNPNIIKHSKATLKEHIDTPSLKAYYKKWGEYVYISQEFIPHFSKVLCRELGTSNIFVAKNLTRLEKLGFNMDMSTYQNNIIRDAVINIKDIDNLMDVNSNKNIDMKLNYGDLIDACHIFINVSLGNLVQKRTLPTVREAFYAWCVTYLGITRRHGGLIAMKSFLLRNTNEFGKLFLQAAEEFAPIREKELDEKYPIDPYDWNPLKEELFNPYTHEVFDATKYLYKQCYLKIKRSQTEKNFELHLEKNQSVKWWYKNGDHGKDYFGINYTHNRRQKIFYPDYIAELIDGTLGIFETKGGPMDEKAADKAAALKHYIKNRDIYSKKLIGGFLTQDKRGHWRINRNSEYKYDIDDMKGWEHLDNVI